MSFPRNPSDVNWGALSKRDFKRAELHYELADEENNLVWYHVVYIDNKPWKEFYTLTSAQKAAGTIRAKYGKTVEVKSYRRCK